MFKLFPVIFIFGLFSSVLADTTEVNPTGSSTDVRYFDAKVGVSTTNPKSLLAVGGSSPNSGTAIYGQSGSAHGVHGYSTYSTGIGVYAQSNQASGYALFAVNSGGGWTGYLNGKVFISGNLGVGVTNPTSKLAVNGTISAKEIKVEATPADFVFYQDYALRPLAEVEKFIQEKKHLPGIPSAAEQKQAGGVKLGEMQGRLLQKLEELTLYVISQQKEIEQIKKENHELKKLIAQ